VGSFHFQLGVAVVADAYAHAVKAVGNGGSCVSGSFIGKSVLTVGSDEFKQHIVRYIAPNVLDKILDIDRFIGGRGECLLDICVSQCHQIAIRGNIRISLYLPYIVFLHGS